MDTNEKGAMASTNDAQGEKSNPIVSDRNLIRQVRRRLKKEGHDYRKVKGEYYTVDLWRPVPPQDMARVLEIPLCEFCGGVAKTVVDWVAVCHGCESELEVSNG